jgi:hypothetical protein
LVFNSPAAVALGERVVRLGRREARVVSTTLRATFVMEDELIFQIFIPFSGMSLSRVYL